MSLFYGKKENMKNSRTMNADSHKNENRKSADEWSSLDYEEKFDMAEEAFFGKDEMEEEKEAFQQDSLFAENGQSEDAQNNEIGNESNLSEIELWNLDDAEDTIGDRVVKKEDFFETAMFEKKVLDALKQQGTGNKDTMTEDDIERQTMEQLANRDGESQEEYQAQENLEEIPDEVRYAEKDGYSQENEYAEDDQEYCPQEQMNAEYADQQQVYTENELQKSKTYEEEDSLEEMDSTSDWGSEAEPEAEFNEHDSAVSTVFQKVQALLKKMRPIDWAIAGTGVVVLVAAIIVGNVFISQRSLAKANAETMEHFASLGQQLDEIGVIGESGIEAVTSVASQRLSSALLESTEQLIADSQNQNLVGLMLNLSSIDHDLKIKVINAETGKMVAGYEFQVEVTDPKGNKKTYIDEDKDGLIHLTELSTGKFSAALVTDETLEKEFLFSSLLVSTTVKDTVEYVKVEVEDEVKSEAEVNTKTEDTAIQEEAEEEQAPALTDTVEWVESTKTTISKTDSYKEIDRSKINDPSTIAMAVFAKTENMKETSETETTETTPSSSETTETTPSTPETTPTDPFGSDTVNGFSIGKDADTYLKGSKPTLKAVVDGALLSGASYSYSWSVSGGSLSSTSGSEVTAILDTAGTCTVTLTVTATKDGANKSYKSSTSITVTDASTQTGTLSVSVGATAKITNTKENTSSAAVYNWSSSDTSIAEVSSTEAGVCVVTGKKAGTVTVTGTVTLDGNLYHTITYKVTVVDKPTFSFDSTTTSIVSGEKATLKLNAANVPTDGSVEVTWKSSDEKIAKVEKADTTTTTATATVTADSSVTAVKSVTITATATAKDKSGTVLNTQEVSTTISVAPKAASNTTSALYTKDNKQVYTVKDGAYVTAVYADYYNVSLKFYVKEENTKYMYTGWQTIDGSTYYFDKNGNKVTGEQVILGAKYNFASDGALITGSGTLGIDVSKWNGSVNWTAVKNAGVSYAIIRCGYRGATTGSLIEDSTYKTNIKGAINAGIKVGVYFFSQAVTEGEAIEEASMCLSLVKGYRISYPIFIDVESATNGRANGLSSDSRTKVISAFCKTIQNGGYTAGIYANKTWLTSKFNVGSLNNYKIWLAQYASAPTYKGKYDLWQYTSKGTINGVSGKVDLNISYLGY